ncbi:MAG: 30S ribosomal protein S16 [Proteobacteria bacterium]|nr:30S ribosomal protein S16 [Pseudomonadota bacterium]
MVRIRLARHGRKNRPFYHVVAADSRFPRDGRFIEKLGKYDPGHHPSLVDLNVERIQHWYGSGAQLSHQVKVILEKHKVALKRFHTHKNPVTPVISSS